MGDRARFISQLGKPKREKERERIEQEITITLDHGSRTTEAASRMPIVIIGVGASVCLLFHFVSLTIARPSAIV